MVHVRTRLLLLVGGCWLGGQAGCSLMFDTSRPQCSSSRDCLALAKTEPGLEGSSCVSGVCAVGAGQAGAGGGSSGECTHHSDCVEAHDGEPFLCRDGACVGLKSGDCSYIIEADRLKDSDDVVLIGAFAGMEASQPTASVSLMSYEMAFEEFNSDYAESAKRTFVGVVCQGVQTGGYSSSINHLTKTLKVPVLLAALPAKELGDEFVRVFGSTNTFFLSPNSSDSQLLNINDRNRLWHMLGRASDLAPGYSALAQLVMEQVTPQPVKVAIVVNDLRAMEDMGDYVSSNLKVNGHSVADSLRQGLGDVSSIGNVQSALLSPNPDVGELLGSLKTFKPDVILALTSSEFVDTVLEPLELAASSWDRAPRYVMSPYAYNLPALGELLKKKSELASRIVGVNFAGADDDSLNDESGDEKQSLNDQYFVRLSQKMKGMAQPGYENFYDAAWFGILSVVAVGKNIPTITGDLAARGMLRLVNPPPAGLARNINSNDLPDVVYRLLDGTQDYYLTGALGPPEFDIGNGSRQGEATAWCVVAEGQDVSFVSDQVRYDRDKGSFVGDPLSCTLAH
jgi:hypothetical protein